MSLTLRVHRQELSLCKLAPDAPAPSGLLAHPFTCFFRTKDEATLVCPSTLVPSDVKTEAGFIAIEFVGPFEFALTGILTQIANPLAQAGVSIVALSTFDTDYVLIKADKLSLAIETIKNAGHKIDERIR